MTECQLLITPEEREFLLELLERSLKETRIEEHRTRTLSYREHVVHHEELLEGLLNKVRNPSSAGVV
jgi:hypothetical protein